MGKSSRGYSMSIFDMIKKFANESVAQKTGYRKGITLCPRCEEFEYDPNCPNCGNEIAWAKCMIELENQHREAQAIAESMGLKSSKDLTPEMLDDLRDSG
jgi:hypothetical protein